MLNKAPACTEEVVRGLTCILRDLEGCRLVPAIRRAQHLQTTVQNEDAWCFGTDTTLDSMDLFLFGLQLALPKCTVGVEQLKTTHDSVRVVVHELTALLEKAGSEATPGKPDVLEREYRARKYAGVETSRLIYNEDAAAKSIDD